uniref:Uncharacterized protein n=1 Tax=Electrophorus electricus TaxID=8005 RepID=A0A4W4F419_ELEEL
LGVLQNDMQNFFRLTHRPMQFSKLSDEGFHNTWSIGSFLVIFVFCAVTLTLMLAVVFNWCCSRCESGHSYKA